MSVTATVEPVSTAREVAPASPVSTAYRRYALWLLLAIYVVNFLDRQVINILAEPIKNDLKLADWQVGLLSGFAFGLVYTVLGFPLARAADRYNRPMIIAACLTAWSAFTGVCGLAQNFAQMAAARAGVGIGEAGCTPTSHALIADYTPKEKRASALAFYSMGTPIGSLLGLALGGALADYFGWRVAFLLAAVPGVLLAVVCVLTLRETRTALDVQAARVAAAGASLKETIVYVMRKKAYVNFAFAAGIRAFIGYGQAPFIASFVYRTRHDELLALAASFGMKPQTFLGLALGVGGGVAGTLGAWLGGQIADRAGRKDLRVFGSMPAIAALVSVPFGVYIFLSATLAQGLVLLLIPTVLGSLWYGPVYASAQGMVPSHMRATSAPIMLFIINFLGLVMGALSIGAVSDILNKGLHLGPAEGMRWALILSTLLGLVSVWLFWAARRDIRTDMES